MKSEMTLHPNRSRFCVFVCALCFITNIGQTPSLIDNYSTRNIIIPLWMFFAIICIFKNCVIYIGKTKSFLQLSCLFGFYYLIGSFMESAYLDSDLPYVIFLSVFILIVGLLAGRFLVIENMESICTSVILSGIIVGLDVFVTYIYGTSLAGRVYTYDSKNSVSQILLTAWFLILVLKFKAKTSILKKLFYLSSFILLTVTLIGLKSRASLIAIPLVFIWLIAHGSLDRRLRNVILLVLGVATIYLIINPDFGDALINQVMLGGRDANSLSDISSGRSDEWLSFWDDFYASPFMGYGRMKRESIILTALLEFGIIGGGIILLMAFWPIYWSVKFLGRYDKHYLMFSSIAIVYIVNGVFEQLSPFGPGVKCFFLWFLIGVRCTMWCNKEK